MHPFWHLVSGLTVWRVYTRVLRSRAVYLTFDDGPDATHTPRLLDLLDAHAAKATFFLRGDHAERNADLTRRLVSAGHSLGNHSFSHPFFNQLPWSRQVEEIARTDRLLQSFDGRAKHVFRPPYGRLTARALASCLLRRQRVALWTHDSLDFSLGSDAVVGRLRQLRLRCGDILLFHDDAPSGIAALEKILPEWRAAGLTFAPL
jgi:peptidoglycan/xylan/chitin deacetylase (PgdA/CDA1 family)